MVEIDVTCHLEAFRRFLVNSTCRSFMPESYMRDPEVFPEKELDPGSIYIEAVDKFTLKRFRDITFVNANEVLGIIYKSKSGHSKLNWRHVKDDVGRVTGQASENSLMNLGEAGIISREYYDELMRKQEQGQAPSPGPGDVIAEVKREAAAEAQPPGAGVKVIPPDEEEDDLEAADSETEEQDDLEEQREETV